MRKLSTNWSVLVSGFLLLLSGSAPLLAGEEILRVEPATRTPAKQAALHWVDANMVSLASWNDQIWEHAELSLQEFKSSSLLADQLERAGFTVKRGVSDMPTAFVAEYGTGKPIIGILAEYDALPDLSQKAVAQPAPLTEGAPGHGCGHNAFGVGSVGAAMAVQHVMQKQAIAGTIRLYGCPAEENYSGKTYMARDGLFDGLDAALHWHPGAKNEVSLNSNNALNGVEIEFFGQTAHAGGSPWSGRSALDAVELLNVAMNYLREHVKLTSRIHYVITEGGGAPNIVPDHAKVWYMIRDQDRRGVEYLHERLLESAKGASLMTRTTYEVRILEGTWNMLVNEEGAKLVYGNLLMVGAPPFTPEELEFARVIQKQMSIDEKGMSTEIEPLRRPDVFTGSGSSDVADVSWITPTAGLSVALSPIGSPGHHWSVVACSGTPISHKALSVAAKTLASTALDLYQNPALLQKMQAEWKEKTRGIPYKSAIPEGQKPPQFVAPSAKQ